MNNQIPRQQIDDILYQFSCYVDHHARTGFGQGDKSYTQPVARDAILAVFKGLPAMQTENYSWHKSGATNTHEGLDHGRRLTRNILRRQILAELEAR